MVKLVLGWGGLGAHAIEQLLFVVPACIKTCSEDCTDEESFRYLSLHHPGTLMNLVSGIDNDFSGAARRLRFPNRVVLHVRF